MEVQMFETVLKDKWTESADAVNGRIEDVPKPEYIMKSSPQDRRKVNLKAGDAIFIHDGGKPAVEPKSVGWVEERIESHVTIDCYSAHSIERIEGYRDDNNVEESYGGLQGEIKRILDTIRGGWKEYYLIKPETWNYMHDQEPGGIWRGQWEVTLVTYRSIQADMNRDIV